jgi:cytoskeletal protein RodZ
MPSATPQPTNTPVVINETATASPTVTPTVSIETATPNQTLTTETVTTSTGTLATLAATITATQLAAGSLTATVTSTPNAGGAATETLHPRFYGTLPPNLPYNGIELLNKSKAEAYISLQATTSDGYTTILEYPVGKLFSIQAPVGKYKYVAWVGGNKIMGSFVLDGFNELRITIFKDRIEIKKR